MDKKKISWLLVFLWMVLIFHLSHQPAIESNGLSTGITEKIIVIVERITPNRDINIRSFNHIIRKNAHLFIYLILGILVSNALRISEVSGNRAIGTAILICGFYAISDEIHQSFVPGRDGHFKDVIIDSAGAIVGILGYIGFGKRIIRTGGYLDEE